MIRFIMAQPAIKYYSWQVEVLLNNMIEIGINLNYVDVVCYVEDTIPKEWDKLRHGYAARFFFYKDTRETKNYISSIRPNILKQHWENHPYLENEVIFYHDCDIIFTRPLDLDKYKKDDTWYGSDTKWYISYDYIIGKGNDIFNKMIDIIDIDPDIIIKNNDNSIGAQYIMKNVDREYWEDVEKDSENLFVEVTSLNSEKKKKDPDYHEIQIWCADMWAVLWNAWKRGYITRCDPDLDFSWGTSTEEDYYKYNIMHNAGVTDDKGGLFFKAKFTNKFPYNLNLSIRNNTASKKYYEWVQKIEKKTVL
jgi:hypothetical protein